MTASQAGPDTRRPQGAAGGFASLLYRRPRLRLAGLLALPLAWLTLLYVVSLVLLLVTAFWVTDAFTGKLIATFTWDNFAQLFDVAAYRNTLLRSLVISVAATLISIALAVPLGIFMAKAVGPRWRSILVMAVTLPLWSGYLVKIYALRLTIAENGPLAALLAPLGLSSPGYGMPSVVIALVYLWFPYMALPVYAAVAGVPTNLIDASSDLGAKSWRTVRKIVLPQLGPAIAAGSTFVFSLSLGDYVAAQFVGGKTQMIGTIVGSNISLNPPIAAAFATVTALLVVAMLIVTGRASSRMNL